MKLRVLSIGKKMPAWIRQGVDEYGRRLPRHLGFEVVEVPSSRGQQPAEIRRAEAQNLLKTAGRDNLVALDERGRAWTTEQLSSELEGWLAAGQNISFLIGGAEGLDESLRRRASKVWCLGPLTLPHQFVRVIVAEQIYRAWSILQGHPYHRSSRGGS